MKSNYKVFFSLILSLIVSLLCAICFECVYRLILIHGLLLRIFRACDIFE